MEVSETGARWVEVSGDYPSAGAGRAWPLMGGCASEGALAETRAARPAGDSDGGVRWVLVSGSGAPQPMGPLGSEGIVPDEPAIIVR
ncbi:MAG: hypothetical protein K0V04_22040, partial [Deltaproteobacteria bacterium]|nr:hypothetical protein [Deltaproteobacteria bacterium]